MVWHSLYGALNGTESPPAWDVKKIASRTLAFPITLWHVPRAFNMCRRSSGVERTLGKGEADSSILSGGTILSPPIRSIHYRITPKAHPLIGYRWRVQMGGVRSIRPGQKGPNTLMFAPRSSSISTESENYVHRRGSMEFFAASTRSGYHPTWRTVLSI